MGELFVLHESFELSHLEPKKRDEVVSDYCESIDLISKNDKLYAPIEIDDYKYSYGDLYNGLIYRPWKEIVGDANLRGISVKTHNLFFTSLFQMPNLFYEKMSHEDFMAVFVEEHFGFNGFKFNTERIPYISSEPTWQDWHNQWLSTHQDEIKFEDIEDDFLSNKVYSNGILKNELIKSEKENLIEIKYNNNIAQAFHSEVMQKKGKDLIAYAAEVGRRVLIANYYKFEEELSSNEQRICKSYRKIYSLNLGGNKKYISIDFEKGMFEFHDTHGKHLGEFKFDGSFNKKAETSHDLRSMK